METTREESGEQVRPHRKWVRLGMEQGSEEKSQLARQDDGGMVVVLTADLRALREEMSEGRVRAWMEERESWRRRKREKIWKWVLDMIREMTVCGKCRGVFDFWPHFKFLEIETGGSGGERNMRGRNLNF